MIARARAHLRLRMTTRLVIGFLALMLITLATFLVMIGIVMRQRMYQTADQNLRNQADTLLDLLGAQEQALAHEAALISNLDGISDALANQDRAQLNHLLIPVAMSRGLDSMYVLDDKRQILFRLGDAITHDALVPRLPIVERGFEFLAATSPLEFNDAVWLVSVAAHRQPRGKTDAVFVLGKRLDQTYLANLHTMLGSHVGILWGNTAVYSFAHPPSELSIAHLRASQHEIAEYGLSNFAFHGMPIEGMPYRVAAFTYFARDGGYINTFLFLPTALLDDSMNQATTGVLALGMLISALGIWLVYLYARGITQPLNRLERAATDIAQGNLEHVVRVENQDEIGMLAQAFEQMRLRVRAMLQAQQQWNVELENQVRAKTSALEQLVENRDQLLGQTITAQEDERRRVARELHDETSQALTALIANLAIVQRDPELATTTATQLKAIRQTAVELLQGVNRIVFDLRPTLLDDYGLIAALSWYAENRLTPNEMRVQIETFGDVVRLPPTVETILFRVGQEALTNIAKYARAQHVLINFLFENGATPPGITLQIQDDGIGFDIDQKLQRSPTDRPSFGLLGMYERINLVGGQIEVRSKPGGGTTICVTVPLPTLSASKGADA